jgi:hypothetical protein
LRGGGGRRKEVRKWWGKVKPKHRARGALGNQYGIALAVTTHPKGGAILFQVAVLFYPRQIGGQDVMGAATLLSCRPLA